MRNIQEIQLHRNRKIESFFFPYKKLNSEYNFLKKIRPAEHIKHNMFQD